MKCSQCNREVNPVEALLNPVCGKCTRLNQLAVTKQGVFRVLGGLGDENVEENPSQKKEEEDVQQEQQEWE